MKKNFKFKHINSALVPKHHSPMYLMHKFWARKTPNVVAQYIRNYTSEGEIVLDPFAGSGVTALEALKLGRKAICLDYNPVATFIAKTTGIPTNIEQLKKEFERVEFEVANKIMEFYETRCPNCNNMVAIIGTKWDSIKNKIIEIRSDCGTCGKRKKNPTRDDLLKLDEIEKKKIPYFYPKTKLRYENGLEFKEGTHQANADDIPSLFTHRNLLALSILYDSIEKTKTEVKDMLKFAFTSSLAQTSKLCEDRPTRPYSSAWITHRYWLPPEYMEFNVWSVFLVILKKSKVSYAGSRNRNHQ